MVKRNNNYIKGYSEQISLIDTGIIISEHTRAQVYDMFVIGKITAAQYQQFIFERTNYLTKKSQYSDGKIR